MFDDQRREDRDDDQQDDEAERDERNAVLAQAPPEQLPGGARGDIAADIEECPGRRPGRTGPQRRRGSSSALPGTGLCRDFVTLRTESIPSTAAEATPSRTTLGRAGFAAAAYSTYGYPVRGRSSRAFGQDLGARSGHPRQTATGGRWRCACARRASRSSSARSSCSARARRCARRSSRGSRTRWSCTGRRARQDDARADRRGALGGGVRGAQRGAGGPRGGARGDRARRAPPRRRTGTQTVLFLDEIHRFNKAQQDALLPAVEDGLLTLIGATTENPAFEVNGALLSRLRVYALQALSAEEVAACCARAAGERSRSSRTDALEFLAARCEGDARTRAQRARAGRRDGRASWASGASRSRASRTRCSAARCSTTKAAIATTTTSRPGSRRRAARTRTRRCTTSR